jgi:hypothetical protein
MQSFGGGKMSTSLAGRAGDADFGTIGEVHEQVTAPAARPGQTFATDAENFSARDALRDLQPNHRAGNALDCFHATLDRAFGFDFQIAVQIRAAHFEPKAGQCLDAKLHEAAGKSSGARQSKARAWRGARWNN